MSSLREKFPIKTCNVVLLIAFIFSGISQAEYRVFNLQITKPNPDPTQEPEIRFILSNLDPEQYPTYYPLRPGETISYTETWRCFGRTDLAPTFCPNPRAPAQEPVTP